MQESDLALLIDAAQEAGRIASAFTGPTTEVWNKPHGAGPVTEADLAVNKMLHATLLAERPDYGWLSEETEDDTDRLHSERVFVIDPIDGTRSFIEGSSTWAHSLAIADKGEITAAVVFLPLRGKLYTASKGNGAFLNGTAITVSNHLDMTGATVLAAKPNYESRHWRGTLPDFKRHYRPSLAYRLALVAEGRFDAMFTMHPAWEWDIAAGDLILREAGATTSTLKGASLRFNNPHPQLDGVVAANRQLHHSICGALA